MVVEKTASLVGWLLRKQPLYGWLVVGKASLVELVVDGVLHLFCAAPLLLVLSGKSQLGFLWDSMFQAELCLRGYGNLYVFI